MSYDYFKPITAQVWETYREAKKRLAGARLEENLAEAAVIQVRKHLGNHLLGDSNLYGHIVEFVDEKDAARRMLVQSASLEDEVLILSGKVYGADGKLGKREWTVPIEGITDLGKPPT
jgi:hypothetical protein